MRRFPVVASGASLAQMPAVLYRAGAIRCSTRASWRGGTSMRISELKTFVVGNPPPGFGGRYFVFLKLVTDDGIEGVGEVYGVPFGPHVVARMIEDVFGRYVLGADPFRIERLWRVIYSAGYSQRPDPSLVGHPQRHRDGLLGHRRQGGGQARLRAARRPRPREAALLHLPLPERGRRDLRLRRPGARRDARGRIRRAGLQRGQVRPGRALYGVRPAPAVARDARAQRALRPAAARGGRRPLRSPVRHAWPADHGRRDPPRPPARALRPACGSRSRRRPRCPRRWPRSRARPRSRSRPASG